MKIVITGALGYIGSRLFRALGQQFGSAELHLVDSFARGRHAALFGLESESCVFHETDLREGDIANLLVRADVVVHLAAITSTGTAEEAQRAAHSNVLMLRRIGEACAQRGVPLIFASTWEVYTPLREVADEECSPEELRPKQPFPIAKLRAERVLEELGRDMQLHFVTLRCGEVVGPSPSIHFNQGAHRMIWDACIGKPIVVSRQALLLKRPYLDIEDALGAFRFSIEKEKFNRQTYNLVSTHAALSQFLDLLKLEVPDLLLRPVDSALEQGVSCEMSRRRFEQLGFDFRGSLAAAVHATVQLFSGLKREDPVL